MLGYFDIIPFILLSVTYSYEASNVFEYTACDWQDSKCKPIDRKELIDDIDDSEKSHWPSGKYALIRPKEGCPEYPDMAWKHGYIAFTWKHPHIFVSEIDCDYNRSQADSLDNCKQKLLPELWPDIRSKMLGPFSRYAIRINFCSKIGNKVDNDDSDIDWPRGFYSVFGKDSECPSGFQRSNLTIPLPSIYTWKTFGVLPEFKVLENDTDGSVSFILSTCMHEENWSQNSTDYYNITSSTFISDDSFVLIKTDEDVPCPPIDNTHVTVEKLKLFENITDDGGSLELLTICHYQPIEWVKGIEKYFYNPQELDRHENGTLVYIVADRTDIYGNTTVSTEAKYEGFSYDIPLRNQYGFYSVTPWLLIDLGRNMIVTGFQFTNIVLSKVGRDYVGNRDSTISGIPCQRWVDQEPHEHDMKFDEMFPERSRADAKNYCRAISGEERIWCYTLDPGIRWDYCANTVFRFHPEDQPFVRCFIGDNRWTIDEFGVDSCVFYTAYVYRTLYYKFRKQYSGRFVKLAGYPDVSSERFKAKMGSLNILTSSKIARDDTLCNEDLGMADKSIDDGQIEFRHGSRPFNSGWCPRVKDPYLSIKLNEEKHVEGITLFNMQRLKEEVVNGKFRRWISLAGSKNLLISLTTMHQNETLVVYNKTFRIDEYLPIERPQTFFFDVPGKTKNVGIYILDSFEAQCLRFELHGCRGSGFDTQSLPTVTRDDALTLNNLQILTMVTNATSVLPSIGYEGSYPGGCSFLWIIDLPEDHFVSLLFMTITFNAYDEGYCKDNLRFLPGGQEGISIFKDMWSLTRPALVKTEESYIALKLYTCTPTSKILTANRGFKAIVRVDDIPTCFSTQTEVSESFQNTCRQPLMYLASLSRLSYQGATVPEEWTIYVNRFSIRLHFIYFNIRCDIGSSLEIKDRFTEVKSYCNQQRVQPEILYDSELVQIKFNKGDAVKSLEVRHSATEWFKAKYTAVERSMAHLIDSERHDVQAIQKLISLEKYWNNMWTNGSLMVYQACSVRFGKCYFIHSGAHASFTWKKAGYECWIRGSRLVGIHSDEELDLIKYMLRNFRFFDLGTGEIEETAFYFDTVDPYYYTHIGLSRVTTPSGKSVHMWEDGSPLTFSAWKNNEPSPLKDCTRMSFHLLNTNNTWESESCESGLSNFFVCESEITPELLGMREWATHLYDGTLSVTLSGLSCQRWDSQYPHSHYAGYDEYFPLDGSTSKANNYCRDPVDNGYIWCYTMDPSIRWERCKIQDISGIIPSEYFGKLSTTSSGKTCQRWDRQIPHSHGITNPTSFPDESVKEASNYCRDPDITGVLWCYTTDPNTRWEICNFIDTASDRCYATRYRYTGQWNQTKSGRPCQHWTSQWPHDHQLFKDSQFPDGTVEDASNYCRDPYNEGFLWCFTTDPALRSEQCVFNYTFDHLDTSHEYSINNGIFRCDSGNTISRNKVCDGILNCEDASDEINCVDKVHPLVQDLNITNSSYVGVFVEMYSMVQCDSLEWISLLSLCDNIIDCIDASDEINCSNGNSDIHDTSGCSSSQYTCDSGECIHMSQMCDFIADCADGSDELCDYLLCSSSEYRCQNQQCIPIENRCDAYEQCLDGSDEAGCDICRRNTFHCDLQRCIPYRLLCDGYPDCLDETDELSCHQPVLQSCESWWFAGYRTTGIYKLNNVEVECDFDSVPVDGVIYTIFHNFEITRILGVEVIHSSDKAFEMSYFKSRSYSCTQNIKQTCSDDYMAAFESKDPAYEEDFKYCSCVEMRIDLNRLDGNYSKVYPCSDALIPGDNQSLQFTYRQSEDYSRNITLSQDFKKGLELEFGPVTCKYKYTVKETDFGCGDGNVFPLSVRCVYDTDPAGYMIGCRSGEHLRGCDNFQCPNDTVRCPGSFCIPIRFLCDGQIQCPGGQDEKDCGCDANDIEVILIHKDGNVPNQVINEMGKQFVSNSSTVREIIYRERTVPIKLDNDQVILDVTDIEIDPFSSIRRQYVCNYTILASEFIRNIKFTKTGSRALIFFESDDTKATSKVLSSLRTDPGIYIYKVVQDRTRKTVRSDTNPFVRDVVVNSWSTLTTLGMKYFPAFCKEAAEVPCLNRYKCATTKVCIPLHQVCDGFTQCKYGDDERSCNYICPGNCTCSEYSTDCSNMGIDDENHITLLDTKSRFLDFSNNPGLRNSLVSSKWLFPYLISLNMSNCDIREISPNIFQSLVNLRILDLSFNKITRIPGYAFVGLHKLKYLHLHGNTNIYSFESFALTGLKGMKSFEIRKATVRRISAFAFSGLDLDTLTISDNSNIEIENDAFSGLKVTVLNIEQYNIAEFGKDLFRGLSGVTNLHTPEFKFCCVRPNYLSESACYPKRDEFSSCDDLIRHPALQTMLWLIGILALLGNILSIVYRIMYDRERQKFGYGIFVTNLAVADFFMGLYLIIIAIADASFKKRYIFEDANWRSSALCTIAGFLSTISSEASVFFLCLITLDRLFVIMFPFGQVRFDPKKSGIACCISWMISISIGIIPVVDFNYFKNRLYSKSGVCIALPLTRDRPPGWMYSIIVFIGLNFATFCLIAIGQIAIYREIKKSTSAIQHSKRTQGRKGANRRKELTVARNLLFIVATDFLCWFPIGCMGIMSICGLTIPGDVYAWTAVFVLPKAKTPQHSSALTYFNAKRVRPFNGMFRYFMNNSNPDSLVCLTDLISGATHLNTVDTTKIVLNLTRCLCLLHKNSLAVTNLNGSAVYIRVECGKVIGDIQLRQEPILCTDTERMADDIYQLSQVIRTLLAKTNEQTKA